MSNQAKIGPFSPAANTSIKAPPATVQKSLAASRRDTTPDRLSNKALEPIREGGRRFSHKKNSMSQSRDDSVNRTFQQDLHNKSFNSMGS